MIIRALIQSTYLKLFSLFLLIMFAIGCGSPQEKVDKLKGQLASLEKEKKEIEAHHLKIIADVFEKHLDKNKLIVAFALVNYKDEIRWKSIYDFSMDVVEISGVTLIHGIDMNPDDLIPMKKILAPDAKKLMTNKSRYLQNEKAKKSTYIKIYKIIKSNENLVSDEEKNEFEKILELEYQLDLEEL